MDESWKSWVKENLARGCKSPEIKDILLQNNFTLPVIKKAMGDKFPENVTQDARHVDYEALANIKITKTTKLVDTDLLQLYTLESFLSEQECNKLVDLINRHLRPSTISIESNDKYFRTSSTCDEEYKTFASETGNRTWTFMVYLNDTIKGGGTQFVNLGKTFYPKKGMAVIWNNLSPEGMPNYDTLHWGLPVEQGEKVIITKWFREKGTGEMFC